MWLGRSREVGEPERNITAQRTGSATGGPGSIVNTGVMYRIGDRPIARSVYQRQVQRIFPWTLVNRESELAELAAFCTRPDGSPYAWWQGPAWAGKSALMAWFVLHPPAGVRVVSFFVTARLAGQSDRAAFLESVIEQLAEVVGQPMPDALTETRQQAWFSQLLHDAAVTCEANEQRLVLLVDGLDEDRGVTVGPNAHSIAALLPAAPPAGTRIIVAGRPDPPVPPDVPSWHPLRDKTIVRPLSASPYAQIIRDDAERELDYLLDEPGIGREILGLVAAAGGGLSLIDLVSLCGESARTIRKTLRSVLGRTFQSSQNGWNPETPVVYVLAHEELQEAAIGGLEADELSRYRDKLHNWAERYREQNWPPETPEYLLRGYPRLLLAIGDVKRATALATDRLRLDRMLDASGGDAAALAEIFAIQNKICDQDDPDLAAMLDLVAARDSLTKRNRSISSALPAVWVKLGNSARAIALARSITSSLARTRALIAVAEALVDADDLNRAREIAELAAATATTTTRSGRNQHSGELSQVAVVLANMGYFDRADAVARSVRGPIQQEALGAVAELLANAGELGRAEAMTRDITDPSCQTRVLAAVAQERAKGGDLDLAGEMIQSLTSPLPRSQALTVVAAILASKGDVDRARQLAEQAEAAAVSGTSPSPKALAVVAATLAKIGDMDRARQLAEQAEAAAVSGGSPSKRTRALIAVAETLANVPGLDVAQRVAEKAASQASSIPATDPSPRAQALAVVAATLAKIGDMDRARQLAEQAEAAAVSGGSPSKRTRALIAVAETLANVPGLDVAQRVAEKAASQASSIPATDPSPRAQALAVVAATLAKIGDMDRARQLAEQAEASARSVNNPSETGHMQAALAVAHAKLGDADYAQAVARSINSPPRRTHALAAVADALSYTGNRQKARKMAEQAAAEALSLDFPPARALGLAAAARALAEVGDLQPARHIAGQATAAVRPITSGFIKERAENAIAATFARVGDLERAKRTRGFWAVHSNRVQALAAAAEAFAERGEFFRAIQLAEQAQETAKSAFPRSYGYVAEHTAVAVAYAKVGDLHHAYEILQQVDAAIDTMSRISVRSRLWVTFMDALGKMINICSADMGSDQDEGKIALNITTLQALELSSAIRARRAIALDLAQGKEYVALLPLMAKIDPAALIEFGNEFSVVK